MATEIEVTKKIKIEDQDIDDIMDTALYGGISYWCGCVMSNEPIKGEFVSEHISRGGTLILEDIEDVNEKWELNKEKLLNGIKKAIEENIFPDYEWIQNEYIDTCMIDAEVADCIVQYALFGEIIFG